MKAIKGIFIAVFSLFIASSLGATTYYVDFVNGANTNPGTKAQPWKSHPYMQAASGCTGTGSAPSYTHAAGDVFIFKGGVSWPNACFRMNIAAGGSSGAGQDQYTVDKTWYTGGSWSKPVFDGGGAEVSNNGNTYVSFGDNYILFDSFEFKGMYWTPIGAGTGTGVSIGTSNYSTVQNCYFHGWTHDSGAVDEFRMITADTHYPSLATGSVIAKNLIDGSDSVVGGYTSAFAFYGSVPLTYGNTVRYIDSCFGTVNGVVHDNLIEYLGPSFLGGPHSDGIQTSGTVIAYNNVIRHINGPGAIAVFLGPTNGETTYFFNNIVYDTNTQFFNVDSNGNESNLSSVVIVNNTINCGSSSQCVALNRAGYPCIKEAWVENNHFITSAANTVTTAACTGTPTTIHQDHEVKQTITQASAQAYTCTSDQETAKTCYQPPNGSAATVDQGTDLHIALSCTDGGTCTDILGVSRPQGSGWDIGAYEGPGSALSAPGNLRIQSP